MWNKPLSLAALLLCGAALAQGTVEPPQVLGTAVSVQGLVTVSDGASIANVVDGNPLVDGSRIVTSSTGSVTVKMKDGCDIKLDPNQSITLQSNRSCEALLASIQSLSCGSVFAGGVSTPLIGLALLTSAAVVDIRRGGGNPNFSGQ